MKPIIDKLLSETVTAPAKPWKRCCEHAVGGLRAVGFLKSQGQACVDKLLAIGSNGQTVIDCFSGEIISRNREKDGYDENELTGWVLSSNYSEPIPMSGIDGGGLKACTEDGWSVDSISINWPIYHFILQHPGSNIFLDHKLSRESEFDLIDFDHKAVAWGFSWSGKTLVLATSSDVIIWTRA